MMRILTGRPFHLNEIINHFIQGEGGGGGGRMSPAVCMNQHTGYQYVGTLILSESSNQIGPYKLQLSHNIQLPNRFSCVLKWYGSDHPILQEKVSMLKTIKSLTIYKVMKSYDGCEDI